MSQSTGDPFQLGHVVTVPPGKSMPPETGHTPFWEKNRGALYVPNAELPGLDLTPGSFVKFRETTGVGSSGVTFNIAYDITNF